jgi:hypothetical protein
VSRFERLTDFLGRAAVATLFLFLSINLLNDFQETRRMTGLLLLMSEGLIVVLMIVRRRASVVDRSAGARIVTALSVGGPPLLRTAETGALLPDAMTATASAVGLGIVIAGKVTLGRSFGIIPANRGVVARGPYAFVRHPIYLGYLLSHLAFVAAHPTFMNVIVVVMADSALIWRALMEERVLVRDEKYRSYCDRVSWHLVPGIY